MPPDLSPHLDDLRQQLAQLQDPSVRADSTPSLPAAWLYLPDSESARWPLWMDLCLAVMHGHGTVPAQGDTAALRAFVTSEALVLRNPWPYDWGAVGASHPPLLPHRVAQLAAYGLQRDEGIGRQTLKSWAPASLQEDLLRAAFTAGAVPDADLCFVQPMVSALLHDQGYGALTELRLWRHDHAAEHWPADAGQLLRAPSAALLPVDATFADGLQRVQDLLQRVLQPHAPAVSWCLRPLKEQAAQHAPFALPALLGPSATAMLALAALVLLRDHVRDHTPALRALKAALVDCDPERAVVSAALGDWPPAASARFWPPLLPVGGATDKLGVLPDVSSQHRIQRCYFAKGQLGVGVSRWQPLMADLGELVQRVANDTSELNADERELHACLVAPDADEAAMNADLLERVAARAAPNSIRGYLLWRYAVHASGQHQPLGPPVRLHRHFVHLQLRDLQPDGSPGRSGPDEARPAEADVRRDIADLLHGDDFSAAPAWSIEAPPYSGKTTLLCEWEMRTAREALRRRHHSAHQQEPWGEMCVLLPLNTLAEALREGSGSFEHKLMAWMQAHAPGLPPLADVMRGRPDGPGLKLRLLFDALDELQAPTAEERRQIEGQLCRWLAQPGRPQLLPPVFTVREQEKASTLEAGRWKPRNVGLLRWRASDMRSYIVDRLGPAMSTANRRASETDSPTPAARMLQALGLSATPDDAELDQQALSDFATFCATPGILSAQCTLLEAWPQRQLPERRPDLLLALVWYSLHRAKDRRELADEQLLPELLRQLLSDIGALGNWRLPPQPGALLSGLGHAADAMQDNQGGRVTVLALDLVFQALKAAALPSAGVDDAGLQRWLAAVRATGLAFAELDRRSKQWMFRFVHPQFQELFAALGMDPDWLPDLTPSPLHPPTEHELELHLLASKYASIHLPRVTAHKERVQMAVAVHVDHESWLRRLIGSGNLAMAATAAAEVKRELERDGPFAGGLRHGPHPVVQHLRRVLLLRSMDAGERVRDRLRAGCVVGGDENEAALAEQMSGFDEALNAHWRKEWQFFLSGQGRDLRHRFEAGLRLGDLGDNLRYEWREGALEGGRPIAGLILKPHQWLWRGELGGGHQTYRIGTDGGGNGNERPSWLVDLAPFQMARYMVTVQEWRAFIESKGYNGEAPWWRQAGAAACQWLAKEGGALRLPWSWRDSPLFNNPMQPVNGITHHEAMAYAAWADMLDSLPSPRSQDGSPADRHRLPIGLPSEVHWEAGVWGPWQGGATRGPVWAHSAGDKTPSLLEFHHGYKLHCRPPVGVYSLGATAEGLFDTAGNTWEHCANALSFHQYDGGWTVKHWQEAAQRRAKGSDGNTPRALRGGSFLGDADYCRVAYRCRQAPGDGMGHFGLRLVRCVLPHSEP